jgi:predicted DNA-binding transcriptional regulator AlpA
LTTCYNVEHDAPDPDEADRVQVETKELITVEVDGVTYYSASEVVRAVGISRQSLWRWRADGKVPPGRRFRDRQLLFTTREVEQVKEYANRLEPAEPASPQLRLFNNGSGGST